MWQNRTKIMSLRLTPKNWEELTQAAHAEGLRTPSEYVRRLITLNCKPLLAPPEPEQPERGRKAPDRRRSTAKALHSFRGKRKRVRK